MSSVLVIGGLGVIGIWVTRRLVEQGHRVITFSRQPDTKRIKDILDKIEVVTGDTTDLAGIVQTIKRYEVERVINLASTTGKGERDPWMSFRLDCQGAFNVLEACRLTETKRVIYTSSKAVYDLARGEYAHPTYKPIDEDYPTIHHRPSEPCSKGIYGVTKLYIEDMGLHYNRIYGLDFVVIRMGTTWGPGKLSQHGSLAPVENIIESARLKKPLEWPQGGDQKDDFIYYKDIANGIALACFSKNLEHHIFHIGSGKGETLTQLAGICNEIFGTSIKIGPGLDFMGWIRKKIGDEPILNIFMGLFNIDRARKEFGFEPKYDFKTGVRDYIETLNQWRES